MNIWLKTCLTLATASLALATDAAFAQKAVSLDELLNHAKGCQADPENCDDTFHLVTSDLDISLKRKAGWKSSVEPMGTVQVDVLRREDSGGQYAVVFRKHAGATCEQWENFLVTREEAQDASSHLAPPGWYAKTYSNKDGSEAQACLRFTGGIITAMYLGPLMAVPESQKLETLGALEAVRVAVAADAP